MHSKMEKSVKIKRRKEIFRFDDKEKENQRSEQRQKETAREGEGEQKKGNYLQMLAWPKPPWKLETCNIYVAKTANPIAQFAKICAKRNKTK